MQEAQQKLAGTPKRRYTEHRTNALRRGHEFNLTFDEWWSLWKPYWEDRGRGGMQMCRTNDTGAYELGNVRIDSQVNNLKEMRERIYGKQQT